LREQGLIEKEKKTSKKLGGTTATIKKGLKKPFNRKEKSWDKAKDAWPRGREETIECHFEKDLCVGKRESAIVEGRRAGI